MWFRIQHRSSGRRQTPRTLWYADLHGTRGVARAKKTLPKASWYLCLWNRPIGATPETAALLWTDYWGYRKANNRKPIQSTCRLFFLAIEPIRIYAACRLLQKTNCRANPEPCIYEEVSSQISILWLSEKSELGGIRCLLSCIKNRN